ncbi:hypothetical protein W97_02570 [Coniosporium apollinis CBS 100218]|uniref:WKF domain-containing protein n=1 Tax=Coniosporium apollinis (strain CBS 100218) TaxID=1168221 RepID=R7YN97_CONA1|nr:uncharacterized protein W97_02570 [Coniosporium apollinis CBS 100218]EON63343.1 hypothetical protein W97_02570 [Coniosporium apollinis CBS 100218]
MSRIPAWKRLGLKLSSAQELPDEALAVPESNVYSKKRKLEHETNGHKASNHEGDQANSAGENGHMSNGSKKRMLCETNRSSKDHEMGPTPRTDQKLATASRSENSPESMKKSRKKSESDHPIDSAVEDALNPQASSHVSGKPGSDQTDFGVIGTDPKTRKKPKKHQATETTTNDSKSSPSSATLAATPQKVTSTPSKSRRKSVAFTPETKQEDGDSAQQLFKAWVQEQNDADAEAGFTPEQIAEFLSPPRKTIASADGPISQPAGEPVKKSKKAKKEKKTKARASDPDLLSSPKAGKDQEEAEPSPNDEQPSVEERKSAKKALREARAKPTPTAQPTPQYLEYLTHYHTNRDTWKFNKAKQTDLLKHLFNIYRIPSQYDDALIAYISGLQGQAARQRLRETATAVIAEDIGNPPAAFVQASTDVMDDPAARKAAHDDALRERLRKEKKRRREEDDEEAAQSEEYQQKLKRRRRAERVLLALGGQDVPNPPESSAVGNGEVRRNDEAVAGKRKRVRKRRVEVVDESSSSSDEGSETEIPSPAASSDGKPDREGGRAEDGEDSGTDGSVDNSSDDGSSSGTDGSASSDDDNSDISGTDSDS